MARDYRSDLRVAGIGPGCLRSAQPARLALSSGPGLVPGPLSVGGAGQTAELVQGQMQQYLGRLPSPAGQATRGDQAPARLLQGIVTALGQRPAILGAGLLTQCLQHRGQGRRARRGQVAGEPPRSGKREAKPQAAIAETVVASLVGSNGAAAHLLGQAGQVGQGGATRSGG